VLFHYAQVSNFLNDNHQPQQPQQEQQPATPPAPNINEWPAVKRGTLDYTTSSPAPGLADIKESCSSSGSIADPRSPMPGPTSAPMQMQVCCKMGGSRCGSVVK